MSGDRKPGEFVGLQYLRGIAASMVVLYHLIPPLQRAYGIGEFPVEALAAGVDIFFCISGFIIWTTTLKPELRPGDWWRTRLIRIVPMYWLALVVGLIVYHAHGMRPLPSEVVRNFLFVPTLEEVPFFAPGWTLHYEFFFYLVLGSLLVIPKPAVRLTILCVFFALLVGLRPLADQTDAIQFRFTSPLLFEFVAGIFIAIASAFLVRSRYRVMLGILSVVAAGAFLTAVSPHVHPHGPRAIYFGAPAALLVFGVVCLEDVLKRHVIVWLKVVGDASYSIYLSHPFTRPVPWGALDALGVENPMVRFAISVPVCIGIGVLVYFCIERPMLQWLRQRLVRRAPHPPSGLPSDHPPRRIFNS